MVIAIITAGGKGDRIGGPVKKQFIKIAGKTLLNHTVDLFSNISRISCIIIVLPENELNEYKFSSLSGKDIIKTTGGVERAESVMSGLRIAEDFFEKKDVHDFERYVLIHDGVRPFASERIINDVIDKSILAGAAVPVVPLTDTLIKTKSDIKIIEYPAREDFRCVQTPQGYRFAIIKKAYTDAGKEAVYAKDESVLVHRSGFNIEIVPGDRMNIKITTADDLKIAESLLAVRKTTDKPETK
jgi:2-C-methyl-D-erythritol 4-phosphate cytidylyltransferase